MRLLRRGVLAVVAAALVFLSAAHADSRNLKVDKQQSAKSEEKRIALVIGNGGYASAPLRNPANDARAVSAALKDLGFEVIHQENLGLKAMGRAIRDFGGRLKDSGGVGLFYYAGHGMQVKGRNYLIPVDADIQNEDEIAFNALDANLVLEKMDTANNRLNLVILDACRNNPFARSFRSGSQGLAQMDAPGGTLVAFATAPGSVAADGEGSNGVYTKYLVENMKTPGLAVEQLFKRVRIGVMAETKERQVPWESSSLKGDFYFKEAPPPTQVAAAKPPSAQEIAHTIEISFWESIRTSRTLADYQAYLEQYPQGRFAALARARVKQITDEEKERPAAVELSYWDSIKSGRSIADFQSYLDQYPNGKFIALARNRLSELKGLAAREQHAREQAAAVSQVASLAPPREVAASLAPGMPRVGDRWTYQYIDGWKNKVQRQITYTVKEVSSAGIREAVSVEDGGAGELAYRAEPMALGVRYKNVEKTEFAPYLTAFVQLKAGDRWGEIDFKTKGSYGHPNLWQLKGRVVGEETVIVPAGKFKAIKVEVTGRRGEVVSQRGAPNVVQHTLWYVPEIKRVVRQETNSTTQFVQRPGDRDIYELVEYKPTERGAGAANRVASVAVPTQVVAGMSPAFPRVGDHWTYRYVDGWKKSELATLTYTVTDVTSAEIVEMLEVDGVARGILRSGRQPRLGQRKVDEFGIVEFSPHLGAFGMLGGKERWDAIEFSGESFDTLTSKWKLQGKVVGRETVTVPAGKFEATRVEITGDRDPMGGIRVPATRVRHTIWYAPEAKRIVKQEMLSKGEAHDDKDRITLELTRYSVVSGK